MPRYTDEEDAYTMGCAHCASQDPHLRSRHYLQLAKDCTLAKVRAHLQGYGMKQERAEDCLRWLAQVIDQYSGIPDPQTGAPLPWWQARQQLMAAREQIAAHCYAEAPEDYRKRRELEPPKEVPGFTRPVHEEDTPFPDEPPYIPTQDELDMYNDPEWWEGEEAS